MPPPGEDVVAKTLIPRLHETLGEYVSVGLVMLEDIYYTSGRKDTKLYTEGLKGMGRQ